MGNGYSKQRNEVVDTDHEEWNKDYYLPLQLPMTREDFDEDRFFNEIIGRLPKINLQHTVVSGDDYYTYTRKQILLFNMSPIERTNYFKFVNDPSTCMCYLNCPVRLSTLCYRMISSCDESIPISCFSYECPLGLERLETIVNDLNNDPRMVYYYYLNCKLNYHKINKSMYSHTVEIKRGRKKN